jgi:hypothetical protein
MTDFDQLPLFLISKIDFYFNPNKRILTKGKK